MIIDGRCTRHGADDVFETHPADAENGPHPHDVYNELLCWRCEAEDEQAFLDSVCVKHRKPLLACWDCYGESMVEEVTECRL